MIHKTVHKKKKPKSTNDKKSRREIIRELLIHYNRDWKASFLK